MFSPVVSSSFFVKSLNLDFETYTVILFDFILHNFINAHQLNFTFIVHFLLS